MRKRKEKKLTRIEEEMQLNLDNFGLRYSS